MIFLTCKHSKKISHELFLWKPLEDVLQQNKGERQAKGRLEIRGAETQPDKAAKRPPGVIGRDAAGWRLGSRPRMIRSRREQKDTGGQRPQEACWQARKQSDGISSGFERDSHFSKMCVCGGHQWYEYRKLSKWKAKDHSRHEGKLCEKCNHTKPTRQCGLTVNNIYKHDDVKISI